MFFGLFLSACLLAKFIQTIIFQIFRIDLQIPHYQGASLVAMRNIIEDLVIRVANNPQVITEPSPDDTLVLTLIRMLSRSDAGSYMVQQPEQRDNVGFRNDFRGGPPRGP